MLSAAASLAWLGARRRRRRGRAARRRSSEPVDGPAPMLVPALPRRRAHAAQRRRACAAPSSACAARRDRAEMTQAVLEGVAYAVRDSQRGAGGAGTRDRGGRSGRRRRALGAVGADHRRRARHRRSHHVADSEVGARSAPRGSARLAAPAKIPRACCTRAAPACELRARRASRACARLWRRLSAAGARSIRALEGVLPVNAPAEFLRCAPRPIAYGGPTAQQPARLPLVRPGPHGLGKRWKTICASPSATGTRFVLAGRRPVRRRDLHAALASRRRSDGAGARKADVAFELFRLLACRSSPSTTPTSRPEGATLARSIANLNAHRRRLRAEDGRQPA